MDFGPDPGQIESPFKVQLPQPLPLRYNIATSQEAPSIRVPQRRQKRAVHAPLGLIPFWHEFQESVPYLTILHIITVC